MSGACLVLGASGRAGRLLRGAWAQTAPTLPVLFHSRQAGPGIDLAGPVGPELAAQIPGPVASLLVLSGVTDGPDLDENTPIALAALELGQALGARQVMLASSAAVYGPPRAGPPWREGEPVQPARPYGAAKRAMEAAAQAWVGAQSGAAPSVLALRLANIIGADMLADQARLARADAPLRLDRFADGRSPRRPYLTPQSLIRLVAALSLAPAAAPAPYRCWNLAEPGPPVEMAALLEALAAAGHPLPWGWQPAPPGALPELALDLDLLAQEAPPDAGPGAPGSAAQLVAAWMAATGGVL